MPRRPSSLSRARWYTFSRNPAPRVLVTSKTAPSTRSVSESNGSAFIGVHRRLNLSAALTRKLSKTIHQPPINADQRRFWPEPRDSPCPVNSWTLHWDSAAAKGRQSRGIVIRVADLYPEVLPEIAARGCVSPAAPHRFRRSPPPSA